MKRYVIGVDGGGTKTDLALFDEDGEKIAFQQIGGTNYEHLAGGCKELEEVLGDAIYLMLDESRIKPSQIAFGVFGLAGVDTWKQQQKITKAVQKIDIENCIVCNDAYLPIKLGCESGCGIAAINGTGCTVAGIEPSGKQLQIGGMGDLSGDCGGGDYLGRQAAAAVYSALFKDTGETAMTQLLFQATGTSEKNALFGELAEQLQTQAIRLKDLNRIVFEAANRNDATAIQILKVMGKENARSVNALIDSLNFGTEFEIVLSGSIYQRGENPTAVEEMEAAVRAHASNCNIRFSVLKLPPVAGAVLWAAERAFWGGIEYRRKVLHAFLNTKKEYHKVST